MTIEYELKMISKSRKERIIEERRKLANVRKLKIAKYTLAGTLVTGALMNINYKIASADASVYTVQKGDTLFSLAKKYGVTIKQIQEVNGLHSDLIRVGQKLEVPTHANYHHLEEDDIEEHFSIPVHKVESGDTLFYLAKKYNVSIEQIKKLNGLHSDIIKQGQNLEIPVYSANHKIKVLESIKEKNSKIESATYVVVPGDTLWSIARRYNTTIESIKAINDFQRDYILIGEKLKIKGNIVKAKGTIIGAVDNLSIEVNIGGKPTVLEVAYATAQKYEKFAGETVHFIYHNSKKPALIAIEFL